MWWLLQQVGTSRKPFELGTLVWVYKHKRVGGYKMEPRWWGPAEITARVGEVSYVVSWENGNQQVHIDDLKEYTVEEFKDEGKDLWFVPNKRLGPHEAELEFAVVEKVVGHRKN